MSIKNDLIFLTVNNIDKLLPLYLVGVGCWYRERVVSRPNGYPDYQWIQCHDGEGQLSIDGCTFTVKPNQGMFLFPNIPHEYHETKRKWTVDWITWNGNAMKDIIKYIGIDKSGVYHVTNSEAILSKMRMALTIAKSNDPFKSTECSEIIYKILMNLLKFASKNSDTSIQQQYLKLKPVFDYIENNYFSDFSIDDLANTANITPQHLCLLFRKMLKERPFEYVNKVRIYKSKNLLLDANDIKISDISKMVGFSDSSYFCSVFKKIEGISPGSFKKIHKR